MPLLKQSDPKTPLQLRLARELTRDIKRGHPWVFAEALRDLPPAAPGTPAILLDQRRGEPVARGFYDPASPLAFRVCAAEADQPLNEAWAENRLEQALALRRALFDDHTTGWRLFNGEGDGLPGLVGDVYGSAAVLRLDGPGPENFWSAPGVARWAAESLGLKTVFLRQERRHSKETPAETGLALVGSVPAGPIPFLENDVRFTADIVNGQKTGFFLDQRENRRQMGLVAQSRRVLNVFGYTGGFSVYAGLGGAEHVTTVDLAAPAIETAQHHWALNNLAPGRHSAVTADAFAFLEQAARKKRRWDLVILDPPSFAPSQKAVKTGLAAYRKLIAAGAAVTEPGQLLAAASCSSHIDQAMFLQAAEEGISQARRRGTVLGIFGQPADHPSPLALAEFRYLKFVLFRLD